MPHRTRLSKRIEKMRSGESSNNRKLTHSVRDRRKTGLKNFSSPVRKDKIRIAKKRVANGFYSRPQISNLIAERIIEDFRNIRNS